MSIVVIENARPSPHEVQAWHSGRDARRVLRGIARRSIEGAILKLYQQRYGGGILNTMSHASEAHHHWYGSPWSVGRDQLDHLIERGLRPNHSLLDVGCGSLRFGCCAIEYLDKGRYRGVDSHLASLEAGANYEIPLHRLGRKRPRLLHDDTFALGHFAERFDWVVALSVLIHLEDEDAKRALTAIRSVLHPGGRIGVNHGARFDEKTLAEIGLVVAHRGSYGCRFLGHRPAWVELVRKD